MANCGVIPELTASEELSAPLYNTLPAPLISVPTAKCVIVFEPAVAAGNVTAAALVAVPVTTVQAAPDRAIAASVTCVCRFR